MFTIIRSHLTRRQCAQIDNTLDLFQLAIDNERYQHPLDAALQLEMDRIQTTVNQQRVDNDVKMATVI